MSNLLKTVVNVLTGAPGDLSVDASAAKRPWPGSSIDQRIDAHATRLWREAGRRGSPGDYRDKARAIVSREDIPQEMESTG